MQAGSQNDPAGRVRASLLGVGLVLWVLVCWSTGSRRDPRAAAAAVDPETRFGVSIQAVRLSANGHMLDFRYRVLDPDKALPLVQRTTRTYLIHQASGAVLTVPEAPTIGPLRQTEKFGKPQADRTYVTLFANPGKMVHDGDPVTVVIGDFKVPDLVVH